jgi:hypothetical protein
MPHSLLSEPPETLRTAPCGGRIPGYDKKNGLSRKKVREPFAARSGENGDFLEEIVSGHSFTQVPVTSFHQGGSFMHRNFRFLHNQWLLTPFVRHPGC